MQQTGQRGDGGVSGPGALAGPDQPAEQQMGGDDDGGTDQGVRPPLRCVPLHRREQREDQPGGESGAGPRDPVAEQADPGRGGGHGQHRGEPQGEQSAVPEGEDGMHQQVVEAVRHVRVAEEMADLADATVRDLVRRRLVPPHAVLPADPPQPERQRHPGRGEPGGGPLGTPGGSGAAGPRAPAARGGAPVWSAGRSADRWRCRCAGRCGTRPSVHHHHFTNQLVE